MMNETPQRNWCLFGRGLAYPIVLSFLARDVCFKTLMRWIRPKAAVFNGVVLVYPGNYLLRPDPGSTHWRGLGVSARSQREIGRGRCLYSSENCRGMWREQCSTVLSCKRASNWSFMRSLRLYPDSLSDLYQRSSRGSFLRLGI
jgi:hypothetical protein